MKFWVSLKNHVSIIGLGYVGLPLAVAAAKSGYTVIGIDLDEDKVNRINQGVSPIADIKNIQIAELVSAGSLKAKSNFNSIKDAEVIIICVPTPLLKTKLPDLSYLERAAESIKDHLSEGSLVILESTVAPGTTRNYLAPLLQPARNVAETTIDLAFSPERIDPANQYWHIENTPKIVAGLTSESRKRTVDFYSKFIDKIVECESLEVAETAKLLENSFRLINISFINEISIFCQKLGVDVNLVIKAAATKPYGFMPFFPSLGVGGHCIPVDPLYLSNKALEIGAPTKLIDLAAQINQEMPQYYVEKAEEKLVGLKGKKILVVGVSYKPNVSDVRETPVEALIAGLNQKGAQVFWHDELVKEWNGENSVPLGNDYDLAILATPHDYLEMSKLGNVPILNTRGVI